MKVRWGMGSRMSRGSGSLQAQRGAVDGRTIALTDPGALVVEPVGAERAFAALYPRLVAAASVCERGAVFVGLVDEDGALVASSVLRARQSLILGRHRQCHLRVEAGEVSLRHLALFAGPTTSDGLPSLRLWDLATARPFVTEDGVRTEAVAGEGPLFATLCRYTLAVLPLSPPGGDAWPASANEAWNRLPRRAFLARLAEGTTPRVLPARDRHTSVVAHLGRTCELDGLDDPATAIAQVVVRCRGRARRYYLDPGHLERGVLIGRYGRCCNHVIDDLAVSRVHLLIASAGRSFHAIDTASTSGSESDAGAFEVLELADRATLSLGDDTIVTWKRYPARQA